LEIARVVGLRLEAEAAIEAEATIEHAEQVLTLLRAKPTVIVLDNAESPWEQDTLATEELLRRLAGVPHLALVVALRGAQRPFGIPWQDAISLTPLQRTDARELFVAVAGERFRQDPVMDELLQALGDLPLAVELMGYTAEGEPDLAGLWERWQSERVKLLQRQGLRGRLESFEVSLERSIGGPRMTHVVRRLHCCQVSLRKPRAGCGKLGLPSMSETAC
jgi:hypothetical protein